MPPAGARNCPAVNTPLECVACFSSCVCVGATCCMVPRLACPASCGKFGRDVQEWGEVQQTLWLGCFSLWQACLVVAATSAVFSFLCALLPLSPGLAYVGGGVSDSFVVVGMLGSIGCVCSAAGVLGVWKELPGYVHAFQHYLLLRLIASAPIFLLDRYTLAGCEGYTTELTRRIDPNALMPGLALGESCGWARTYFTVRFVLEAMAGMYSFRAVYLYHDQLREEYPRRPDFFEDPVEVFRRFLDQAKKDGGPSGYGSVVRQTSTPSPYPDPTPYPDPVRQTSAPSPELAGQSSPYPPVLR